MPSIYSRRHFLRAALLSGGALTAATLTPALLPLAARAGGLLPGGAPAEPLQQTSLFMGTMVSISVAQVEPGRAEEGMARAFALGRRMADVFTRFDASSPVGALNADGPLYDAPPESRAPFSGGSSQRMSRPALFGSPNWTLSATISTAFRLLPLRSS